MFSSEREGIRAKFLCAVLAGTLLAACQPLPRPFAPSLEATKVKLFDLSDHSGIVVLAVAGVDEPRSRNLAAEMAKALRAQNVPAATTGSNSRSRFLQGWVTTRAGPDERVRIELVWDLFEANGDVIGSQPVQRDVGRNLWESGDGKLFDELTAPAAKAIAALVQAPAATGAAPVRGPPLHVGAVAGATGDGGIALRQAMARALGGAGFRLTDAPAPDGLVVTGQVALSPPRKGRQMVEIVWQVRRTDGADIGKLTQSNAVPAGSLEGIWGGTARAIADAAVGGVRDLLSRAKPSVSTP